MTQEEALDLIVLLFDADSVGEAVNVFIDAKKKEITATDIINAIQQNETLPAPPKEEREYTENTHMPFGKYKGTKLQDLPKAYINWLKGLGDSIRDKKLKKYLDGMDNQARLPFSSPKQDNGLGEVLDLYTKDDDVPF